MKTAIPDEIKSQVASARSVIQNYLPGLKSIHLYGSAIDGGLKSLSDIDLFVCVDGEIEEHIRHALLRKLLEISAPPGTNESLRALEVTVVNYQDVVPWRHPAKRELQFGEWLRQDIVNSVFEKPILDHDLAILLTKIRQNNIAVLGPEAADIFEPVPEIDFLNAMTKTLSLWNSPEDWKGDEKHIALTLARIWYSIETGNIASKDAAAAWAIDRLPSEHRKVLQIARDMYLGLTDDNLTAHPESLNRYIEFTKDKILRRKTS